MKKQLVFARCFFECDFIMINEYLKQNFDPKCARLYDQMVIAIRNCREIIDCGKIAMADIIKVYLAVMADHPEFFYLTHAPEIAQRINMFGHQENILILKNIFSKSQIREYNFEIEKVKQKLYAEISKLSTNQSKEKAICEYLITNVRYEINNKYNQNAATVLIDNKGQCSGIAKATKLLCDFVNIPCIVVNGDAEDRDNNIIGPHAWNIVNIDDDFYHLDVTYMLGANLNKVKPYSYLYFNYSDRQIAKDHSWDRTQMPPCLKDATVKSSLVEGNPKISREVKSLYELREFIKQALKDGERELSLLSYIKAETNDEMLRMISSTIRNLLTQSRVNTKIEIAISNGNQINIVLKD